MLISVTYFEIHPKYQMDWWTDRGRVDGQICDKTDKADVNCGL